MILCRCAFGVAYMVSVKAVQLRAVNTENVSMAHPSQGRRTERMPLEKCQSDLAAVSHKQQVKVSDGFLIACDSS